VIKCADYLIDLHGGDMPEYQADYAIFFETGSQDADLTSMEMAKHFGAPYVRRSSALEGDRDTGPAARMAMQIGGIPSIVTEVGDAGALNVQRLAQNTTGLMNVMKLLSMLSGSPDAPPAGQREMVSRTPVLCSKSGLSTLHVEIGQSLEEGEPIADLMDPFGGAAETIVSPCKGDVVQLFYQGWMNEGEIIAKIAALAERGREGSE